MSDLVGANASTTWFPDDDHEWDHHPSFSYPPYPPSVSLSLLALRGSNKNDTSSPLYPSHNIIQTSDGVLFGVHILLLKFSSSVMNDMLTVGSGSGDRDIVTITEDSTIFERLLSFIYPDRSHFIFKDLSSLMPVLDAAAKYDMKGVVEALSLQLTKGMMGDPLMYQDPLWVYAKAKQLDIARLEKAAAKATLTIDLSEAPCRPEVANVPASWIFELLALRAKHVQWWRTKCQQPIPIAKMSDQYEPCSSSHGFYRQIPCQCPQNNLACAINPPMEVVRKIMERPCAKSVREIDFNRITKCLRCGAAVTAHYRKICLHYETKFGGF